MTATETKQRNLANRRRMLRTLRSEVLGPSPVGRVLAADHPLAFTDADEFYGPHIQAGTLNEIVKGETPKRRYGAGILFPIGGFPHQTIVDPEAGAAEGRDGRESEADGPPILSEEAKRKLEVAKDRTRSGSAGEQEGDELGISLANELRPSSMGISCLVDLPPGAAGITVLLKGGRYRRRVAVLRREGKKDASLAWWFRSMVVLRAEFGGDAIMRTGGLTIPVRVSSRNAQGLDLDIRLLARPLPARAASEHTGRLVTISIVNRSKLGISGSDEDGFGGVDESCLFQAEFSVTAGSSGFVCPYPERLGGKPDPEEQSFALLYRHAQTFATGHGCAADWRSAKDRIDRARAIRGLPMPVVELPATSPDIFRDPARQDRIQVEMRPLAGLVPGDDGLEAAREVVDRYASWIVGREAEIPALPREGLRSTARQHLSECRTCHRRMTEGLALLQSDPVIRRAFMLANHAMLLQQEHSFRSARPMVYDESTERISFGPAPGTASGRGSWRPFQLAFLLMSLRSTVDGAAPERDMVELIWFPTGGGKTEAYLGLTAFALFHRRLVAPGDNGTHVLMRYTLRLLTAQQFQRASGLICAMEHLRRQGPASLGDAPFSIGIWLGGDTTPNSREDARESFRRLERGEIDADYNFIVLRCPWCGAQMGPVSDPTRPRERNFGRGRKARAESALPNVLGLQQLGGTVVIHCPDATCQFHRALPIKVIDDDLYDAPPDLVIGTVDKFAGLAWKDKARALFGLSAEGTRTKSPPGLIIQDELHLITGPLGSMAGLYETLIEELCTDRRSARPVRPKIVSSTATTRRYSEQIHRLYNRPDSCLFPPPGLEAGESFFASQVRDSRGRLDAGRMYVGINATAYSSGLTTNVRVFGSLLQGARLLEEGEARDPWWTLLVFFNSLRELGNSLTLFQGDIPERIREISRRYLPDPATPPDPRTGRRPIVRYIGNPLELTGRISSSEVPGTIAQLETEYGTTEGRAVDVCLASNIIEVGVDIDRLSLMAVAGQPKSTAQYIQVTGRIGRRGDRPGLVAMIYSAAKPRDRSHFERFRSYHERLYAQVEPASVTPFTKPALERALHAVLAGYVRQTAGPGATDAPTPFPAAEVERIRRLVLERATLIEPSAVPVLTEIMNLRLREWLDWTRVRWDPEGDMANPSLLRYTGSYYPPEWTDLSWPTPTSMRSVDAVCMPEITMLYQKKAVIDPPPPAP